MIRSGATDLGAVYLFNAFILKVILIINYGFQFELITFGELFKLEVKINVFFHQDVDRHVFYGGNRFLEYNMIA